MKCRFAGAGAASVIATTGGGQANEAEVTGAADSCLSSDSANDSIDAPRIGHSVAGCGPEISRHLRGLDGLEENLSFEKFRKQEHGQCEPWMQHCDRDGQEGEREPGAEKRAEWSKLKSGAVGIR